MSDYTPTTSDVSRIYMLARHAEDASLKSDPDNSDALDEFHRWYAAEKRKWQAEALRDAADSLNLHRQVPEAWSDRFEEIFSALGIDLCADDDCLWWQMTYALQGDLRERAASLDAKIGGGDD